MRGLEQKKRNKLNRGFLLKDLKALTLVSVCCVRRLPWHGLRFAFYVAQPILHIELYV